MTVNHAKHQAILAALAAGRTWSEITTECSCSMDTIKKAKACPDCTGVAPLPPVERSKITTTTTQTTTTPVVVEPRVVVPNPALDALTRNDLQELVDKFEVVYRLKKAGGDNTWLKRLTRLRKAFDLK